MKNLYFAIKKFYNKLSLKFKKNNFQRRKYYYGNLILVERVKMPDSNS